MADLRTAGPVIGRRLLMSRMFDGRRVLAWGIVAILAVLVIVPIIVMVLTSFRPAGTLPFEGGEFTTEAFSRAYGDTSFLRILFNTFLFSIGGLVFALPMAFGFAFLTERTDMPLRNAMYSLFFIPMSIPVFATALGWVLLLGPRAGTLNQWFRLIVGSDTNNGPFNIFSMAGLIFVHALGIVPSMWLLLISVMRNMDPALEEAASVSGASRLRVLAKVTGPLMRPGVAAVAILFFIVGIESLELPLALGPTAGIEVLSTKIFFEVFPESNRGIDYAVPAAFGMLALVMGIMGISLYLYLVRRASRFAVVMGKGYRPKVVQLGRWKWVALGTIGLYMLIKVILPLSVLVFTSFLAFYQPPVPDKFGNLVWTLSHYEQLFDYRFYGRFFINTILVSVAAATVTMLFVSVIAWLIVRFPSPLTRFINGLAFMPLAIPGVISTLAFFLLFIGTPLYGTLIILVIAFTARFLVFGTRIMHSAQLQIHKELEEAAVVNGVGTIRSFFAINMRLLIPAFVNGWLYILTHASKDFSVALLLASASSLLVGNVIYGAFNGGRFPDAAAMMISLVVFNLTIVIAGRRWLSKAVRG